MREETVYRLLPVSVRQMLKESGADLNELQEIRMRAGQPLLLQYRGAEAALEPSGRLTGNPQKAHIVSQEEIKEALEYVSGYSLYAFDEEMKQGFLTVPGGHRIGVAGHTVFEDGKIGCIRYIAFLNIRLSHQKKGCADMALPFLYRGEEVCSTLILSPPGCGKTTILRDLIRQISDGQNGRAGRSVGVVDERSELAGACLGIPQNDLGMRTDVLDGCPKAEGMMMLLRSMAPEVIAVDELGGTEDIEAAERVFHCGCRLLATVHGDSVGELERKPFLGEMIRERFFDRYLILSGRKKLGTIAAILDGERRELYRSEG